MSCILRRRAIRSGEPKALTPLHPPSLNSAFRHYANVYHLIDLLTILPVFASLYGSAPPSFLRALRAVRALRVLRGYRVLVFTGDQVQKQVAMIGFSIISMLFLFSCFAYIVENEFNPNTRVSSFHVALYWMVVTVTTTGYGDISPSSDESQMVIMVIMAMSWFVMSVNLAKLITIFADANNFGGRLRWSEDVRHVVVTGIVTHDGLKHVLRELFHPSNAADKHVNVAVLMPKRPSIDVVSLLKNPAYVDKLQILVGSPLFEEDLARVRMREAVACFMLTDKYTEDPESIDIAIILQALAVAEYAPTMRWNMYVQLVRRNSKAHLVVAGIPNVISIDEMKLGILGQACVAPGVSTMITNLVRATSIKRSEVALPYHSEFNAVRPHFFNWMDEYRLGCLAELSAQPLRSYAGYPVGQVTCALFLTNGALLFALETWEQNRRRIIVKPDVGRAILADDIGYFIASALIKDVTLERSGRTVPERIERGRTAYVAAELAHASGSESAPSAPPGDRLSAHGPPPQLPPHEMKQLNDEQLVPLAAPPPPQLDDPDVRRNEDDVLMQTMSNSSEDESSSTVTAPVGDKPVREDSGKSSDLHPEAPHVSFAAPLLSPMPTSASARSGVAAVSSDMVSESQMSAAALARQRFPADMKSELERGDAAARPALPAASRLAAILLDEQIEEEEEDRDYAIRNVRADDVRPIFIEELHSGGGATVSSSHMASGYRAPNVGGRARLMASIPQRRGFAVSRGIDAPPPLTAAAPSTRAPDLLRRRDTGVEIARNGQSVSTVRAPAPPKVVVSAEQQVLPEEESTSASSSSGFGDTDLHTADTAASTVPALPTAPAVRLLPSDLAAADSGSLGRVFFNTAAPSIAATMMPPEQLTTRSEGDDSDDIRSEADALAASKNFLAETLAKRAKKSKKIFLSARSKTKTAKPLAQTTTRDTQQFLSGVFDNDEKSFEELPELLYNHVLIVVYGTPTEDIVDVIAPMRSRLLTEQRTIVVLFELMPSDVQWQVIGRLSEGFGNIQFIHGNPLLHLSYGSIHTAAQVLVLNCSTRDATATGAFDAAVIVISRSIESRHPSLFLLAEVAEGNSIRFLGTGRASDMDSQQHAPFALDYMFRPRFAAGRVFAVSVLDSLVARAFSNPAVLAVIKLMISSSNKSAKIYLTTPPRLFVNKRYDALVTHLLARNILAMGVFRSAGHLNSHLPFVFTNPPPNTIIGAEDRVFVLADEQPLAGFQVRAPPPDLPPAAAMPAEQRASAQSSRASSTISTD
jgi:hypothetical protein